MSTLDLSCAKRSVQSCPKMAKEAVKLEVCPRTNPEKSGERQVLVDKIQAIKEGSPC